MLIRVILPALSDPSNAYNSQHLHVLESLAQVKSIVLLTDIPSSEELTQNLFALFFDILAGSPKVSTGEQQGKKVENYMTSILGTMVDESVSLSPEVIDAIIAQFLRTDPRAANGTTGKNKKSAVQPALEDKQSRLVLNDLPPAYNMARTVCNSCPEKMGRYINQYFNDVIMEAASFSSSTNASKGRAYRRNSDNMDDSDEEPSGPTEEDLKDLHKAHQLLRELWRASPRVLQNVIPQLEVELSAENVQLRLLATETLGDIISGIGSAGLPPPPTMDPSVYPPLSLSSTETRSSQNLWTKPSSPLAFTQEYHSVYANFLRRKIDKSPVIRSAWTTGIGRILATSAGGIGLNQNEERGLIDDLANMMADADERVRIAAVRVVGTFSLRTVIDKLGSTGSVTTPNSVLGTLADRVRDRKHSVRVEAMRVLARIWGVAAGEIATGEEKVVVALGAAPSKILETYYANDMEINALLDRVIFEQLLPMSYPPIKAKNLKNLNGNSQRVKDSHSNGEIEAESVDPDKIRTERILIFVKSLEERAKKVFYAIQARQLVLAKLMTAYLQRCEDYNVSLCPVNQFCMQTNQETKGGVMDENETKIKEHLTRLIDEFSKSLPDASKTRADLWKFAKLHDRRSYQLIRFCIAPESDYRTVFKAMVNLPRLSYSKRSTANTAPQKEFTKRIESSTLAPAVMLDTLTPLLYRVGVIIYNKSHVPAIMEYSRSDEKSLAGAAHEVLREISSRNPEVLKAHVQEICKILEEEAPTPKKANDPNAVDNLKACASFALKFPKDIPQDRKFVQAMTNFALLGTPPETAKYAVSIIMATSDKKEMLAKDLVQKCVKNFEYGGKGFLSRLATLSQLMLLAPDEVDDESDSVIDIAIQGILLQVRTPSTEPSDAYSWSKTADSECEAKCWALKILVNRIRSHPSPETLSEHAAPVYNLLSTLIIKDGEVTPKKNTPPSHKPRLRLLAARLYLKLCTKKAQDSLLTSADFNALACVAQDAETPVRSRFLQRLRKYLGQQKLPQRYYAIPFLLAFEPNDELKSETTTWIRSRATYFSNLKSQSSGLASNSKTVIVLESVFARLISLLAHHPDYGSTLDELLEFSRYIIFYLQNVATEENLSLIYHIAQRVKQCSDAISPSNATSAESPSSYDSNLFHLSDLAQLTIRKFEEAHSWSIQTLPAKIRLPRSLFTELKSHDEAQRIAEHNHLPEGVEDGVEGLVKASMRAGRPGSKKRKSEGEFHGDGRDAKKSRGIAIRKAEGKEKKSSRAAVTKTPKRKPQPAAKTKAEKEKVETSGERRRSGRVKMVEEKSYAEREDEEDDDEMEVLSWEYLEGEPESAEADIGDENENGDELSDDDGNDNLEKEEEKKKDEDAEKEKDYGKIRVRPTAKVNPREKKIANPSPPSKPLSKTKSNPKPTRSQAPDPASRANRRDTRAAAKQAVEAKVETHDPDESDDDEEISDPPEDLSDPPDDSE